MSSINRLGAAVAGCFGLLEISDATIAHPKPTWLSEINHWKDEIFSPDSEVPTVSVHLATSPGQRLADQNVSYTRDIESY
jgi:hypothetical protein